MSTWTPSEQFARMAPALVCNVASRIVWLRKKVLELPPAIQAQLAPFTAPMPFEAALLSGRMERIELLATLHEKEHAPMTHETFTLLVLALEAQLAATELLQTQLTDLRAQYEQ